MRVTLSPVVQTFGANAPDAGARDEYADTTQADLAPHAATQARIDVPANPFGWTAAQSDAAPDLTLDPDLQAWLAPVSAGAVCGQDPLCATLPPPAAPRSYTAPDFDRDALMRAAREELTAPRPASQGSFKVVIDVAHAEISGQGAGGALQLRFDPRFGGCEPVYVAVDCEAAVSLARQILAACGGAR